MGLANPSFNRYKIAHTLLGRSCTLYFETVLGMNKITPKNKKKFPKNFSKNLFKGVGLATLSLNRYNMAQGLLRKSCFKYLNIMKKQPLPLPLPPPLKNSKKFIFFDDIFIFKLPYLILRSGKFGNLVTSFFVLILLFC